MNKHETAAMLSYLASAYPNAKVTRETSIVFHDVLKDLAVDKVMFAARELVRESEWFPSASQLLKSVARRNGNLSPIPSLAWQEVIRMASEHGQRFIPKFSHATTAAVVQAIGWREICMSENANVLRSNFLKMYEGMAEQIDRKSLAEMAVSVPNALYGQKALESGDEANEGSYDG